jgi:hypothetical protein
MDCLNELKRALMSYGGDARHGFDGFQRTIDINAAEARRLLTEGIIIPYEPQRVRIQPMQSRECHRNSGDLAAENPDFHVMTGLGMGDPFAQPRWDVWRVHTWVVTSAGIIIETTTPRQLYAGFLVSPDKPGAHALAQRLRAAHRPLAATTPRLEG